MGSSTRCMAVLSIFFDFLPRPWNFETSSTILWRYVLLETWPQPTLNNFSLIGRRRRGARDCSFWWWKFVGIWRRRLRRRCRMFRRRCYTSTVPASCRDSCITRTCFFNRFKIWFVCLVLSLYPRVQFKFFFKRFYYLSQVQICQSSFSRAPPTGTFNCSRITPYHRSSTQ